LQLRTKLQHSWATAVETLGIVEKSSFKTGEGEEKFKEFFKLSSALFSLDEGMPVLDEYRTTTRSDLIKNISSLEDELQITAKLEGLAITAKHIEVSSKNKFYYQLMELNLETRHISIIPFAEDQLNMAEFMYTEREKKTRDNQNISVVLISTGNVKDIKKAYPNYFLDTNSFIKNLKRICWKQG